MMKIRKKSKLTPFHSPRLEIPEDDKGIKPYVAELRVVEPKNRTIERKVKTSHMHLNRKIKTSMKRCSENRQLNGDLCGWLV